MNLDELHEKNLCIWKWFNVASPTFYTWLCFWVWPALKADLCCHLTKIKVIVHKEENSIWLELMYNNYISGSRGAEEGSALPDGISWTVDGC